MKRFTYLSILPIVFLFPLKNGDAAIAYAPVKMSVAKTSTIITSKEAKQKVKLERRSRRLMKKMNRKLQKADRMALRRNRADRGQLLSGTNYLRICVGVFLLSLLFFIIGGSFFNIIGSVFALAAVALLILWLMDLDALAQ